MQLIEHSVYVPQAQCRSPIPEWKKFDEFRDALPQRDQSDIDNESCKDHGEEH